MTAPAPTPTVPPTATKSRTQWLKTARGGRLGKFLNLGFFIGWPVLALMLVGAYSYGVEGELNVMAVGETFFGLVGGIDNMIGALLVLLVIVGLLWVVKMFAIMGRTNTVVVLFVVGLAAVFFGSAWLETLLKTLWDDQMVTALKGLGGTFVLALLLNFLFNLKPNRKG